MLHAGLCIFSKSDQTREKKPPKESLILIFFSPKKRTFIQHKVPQCLEIAVELIIAAIFYPKHNLSP